MFGLPELPEGTYTVVVFAALACAVAVTVVVFRQTDDAWHWGLRLLHVLGPL